MKEKWVVGFGTGKIWSAGSEPRHIATMRPTCVNSEWEADARLIAAAPDLLEACKSAVFRLNEISNLLIGDPTPAEIQQAYNMAFDGIQRAAISKAEGK